MIGNVRKEEREMALKRLQLLVEERKTVEGEVSGLRAKVDISKKTDLEAEPGKEVVSGVSTKRNKTMEIIYDEAESAGFTKEMLEPAFIAGISEKDLAELNAKVREEYYRKKGIPEPEYLIFSTLFFDTHE